jgi:predicted Zn-dependent protease with MMP-like domain
MDPRRFTELAEEALSAFALRHAGLLENVAVVVESRPGRVSRRAVKLKRHETLLGLYEGVPRIARSHQEGWMLPDKITLFQEPIEAEAEEMGQPVEDVIRDVLVHEVAHHLGYDERDARRIERHKK